MGSTLRPVTYKAAERTLGTIITEHKWIDEVPAFASEVRDEDFEKPSGL